MCHDPDEAMRRGQLQSPEAGEGADLLDQAELGMRSGNGSGYMPLNAEYSPRDVTVSHTNG